MVDITKTSPEKLAEMCNSLMADNTYLRERIQEFKRAAYKRGLYSFPPPPVITQAWNDDAWIAYIDKHGSWMK